MYRALTNGFKGLCGRLKPKIGGAGMLEGALGAAALLEPLLTKSGPVRRASSLEGKSVHHHKTHQSSTYKGALVAQKLLVSGMYIKRRVKLEQSPSVIRFMVIHSEDDSMGCRRMGCNSFIKRPTARLY